MTLSNHPPHDRWHDWTELDAKAWPRKVERNYTIVPTTCFNCEAACGLTAFVDQETRRDRQVRGQPRAPGQPRPQLREGPGDAQPGRRPRADPVPAQALRPARQRPVGAHHLGPGARRDRRPHPHAPQGGPQQRDHVPRRPARRGRLHRAGAAGLGRRRPQQPHQHLLVERPHRLPVVDGPRPPVERLRERRGDLPHLGAPRGRPLLQPARAADHGGPGRRAPRSSASTRACRTPAPRPTTGSHRGPAPRRSCCSRSRAC